MRDCLCVFVPHRDYKPNTSPVGKEHELLAVHAAAPAIKWDGQVTKPWHWLLVWCAGHSPSRSAL